MYVESNPIFTRSALRITWKLGVRAMASLIVFVMQVSLTK